MTRGPCRRAEGRRRYFCSLRRVFRRLVPMDMDSCFCRNDGKRLDESRYRGYKPLPQGQSSAPLWERPLAATSSSFRKFHAISTERIALCNISYSLRFLASLELTVLLCHYVNALPMDMDSCFCRNDGKRPDESRHRGYKPLPQGQSSAPLWERPLAATSSSFRKFHAISTERTALCNLSYSLRFLASLELTVLLCHYVNALPMDMDSCFCRNDGKRPDESRYRGYKPLPQGQSSAPLWERPLAATSAGAWVGMTELRPEPGVRGRLCSSPE
jgi:hypothetical protein